MAPGVIVATPRDDIIHLGEKAGRGLDAEAVKRDLAALWKEEGAARQGVGPVNRVCNATVVLPLRPEDDAHELTDDLVRLHPSRVIVIHYDPGRPRGDAEAWVSAACTRGARGRSLICCETVNIEAGPGTEGMVASAVRSLSVGGVPVEVVAERISPLALGWLEALGDHVDVVLGDGTHLDEASGFALWRRCVGTGAEPPSYRDVLWSRLVDWRCALALPFDRAGGQESLHRLARVTVEVGEGPGSRLKAWLLFGWLGTRLGWRWAPEAGTRERARFEGPSGVIEALAVRDESRTESAVTLSVSMEFRGRDEALSWRRLARERAIVVERGGARVARLNQSKTSRSAAVVQEVQEPVLDPVAREAMGFALGFERLKEESR
jgi:glucose-6-phosphate dehydrogenase assembly protein OpcA